MVDYGRVNARKLRAIYYVRSLTDVVQTVSGSVWFSFFDAVAGFNQIGNTPRAKEMFAILSRSGQLLPVCLTFGSHNGPENFSFVVDGAYSPRNGAKQTYCVQWQAYVDDLTVRTGRVLDGVWMTDDEYAARIAEAVQNPGVNFPQTVEETLK